MKKRDLAEYMAGEAELPLEKAEVLIDSIFGCVEEGLRSDQGKVRLNGLGTFVRVLRKPRNGVNPRTGEKIHISERTAIRFQPGAALKRAMDIN